MLVYNIVDLAYQLHFFFASDNQLAILCIHVLCEALFFGGGGGGGGGGVVQVSILEASAP